MKAVAVLCTLALVLWMLLFMPAARGLVPFWPAMMVSTGVLTWCAVKFDKAKLKSLFVFHPADLFIGLIGVAVLYGVFYLGFAISTRLFGFAAGQVDSIYDIRKGINPILVSLLLVFWIGPAEEIFWRGFVQQRLSARYGTVIGFLAASAIYAAVHCVSFNFMLTAAAAICGGFWGLMFAWRKNLWPVIISHAVWDILIFILFPIQ